jgi:HlyD family secretion protein
LIVFIAGGIGAWATYAPLSGAVIASGGVVVDSNVKKVQHPTGGVVGKIFVHSGDWVKAGDLVMHLDDTQTRANLGIVVSQFVQLKGRKARLEAERDGKDSVTFPPDYESSDPEASAIAAGERRLFESRRALKSGQVNQLRERVGQFRQEIIGLTAQRDAKKIEIELMKDELEKLVELRRKELIPQPRVLAAQRDLTKLQGEWGSLEAQIARSLGSISEVSLQIIAVDQTVQTDANKEIREIEAPNRHRARAVGPYGRRRDRARRTDHVDRPDAGFPRHRGPRVPDRHRSDRDRAEGGVAVHRFQSAHDAGILGRGFTYRSRHHERATDECILLPRPSEDQRHGH